MVLFLTSVRSSFYLGPNSICRHFFSLNGSLKNLCHLFTSLNNSNGSLPHLNRMEKVTKAVAKPKKL